MGTINGYGKTEIGGKEKYQEGGIGCEAKENYRPSAEENKDSARQASIEGGKP